MSDETEEATFVIVGGGIAGVSCAEILCHLAPDESTVLISASPVVKAIRNVRHLTPRIASFDVDEVGLDAFSREHAGIQVINDVVVDILTDTNILLTEKGRRIKYKKLCLCHGARPKLIASDNPFVLGIRDTESVLNFQDKLRYARRIVVVGNGGIATELVYELKNVDVVWAVKDDSISAAFVDAGAGEFFVVEMNKDVDSKDTPHAVKRLKYTSSSEAAAHSSSLSCGGGALGPDWHSGLTVEGVSPGKKAVKVEFGCEIKTILTPEEFRQSGKSEVEFNDEDARQWNVYLELSSGKVFGCDFAVSATGVIPNGDRINVDRAMNLSEDGAILVDDNMATNLKDVFAAGDVCHAAFAHAQHWFQMRLWTQARQFGLHAGQCMAASLKGERLDLDFCFEMFTHATRFFGHKVVLLGLFNGQKLEGRYEVLLRMTRGKEYVKTVMREGRMQGAVLIGETDLEETFENLILNQMDLSAYGEDLLDPDVDIEDYFD